MRTCHCTAWKTPGQLDRAQVFWAEDLVAGAHVATPHHGQPLAPYSLHQLQPLARHQAQLVAEREGVRGLLEVVDGRVGRAQSPVASRLARVVLRVRFAPRQSCHLEEA